MPFVAFSEFYLDVAKREIRTLTLPEGNEDLPADTYAFFEMYCDEPSCDCRRVFFTVISERHRNPLAVVAYGWERLDFYARWLKGTPVSPKLLKGPILEPWQPAVEICAGAVAFGSTMSCLPIRPTSSA